MKRHRFAKIVNTDFQFKAESIDNNLFIDWSHWQGRDMPNIWTEKRCIKL